MRITKKRFIDLMTNNKSICCGSVYSSEHDAIMRVNLIEHVQTPGYYRPSKVGERECYARSRDLVFNDGSRRRFSGRDCELIQSASGIILALHEPQDHGEHVYYYLHGVTA